MSEKLGGRENRLIICFIKTLIWLVKESSTLGVMSSYLLIKILWISTSHLLYLILSIMFLYLPWMVFLLHHLFVNLLHQKIYLSVNLKKYLTLDEMVLLLESTWFLIKYINCVPIFVTICFVYFNLVLKIVLYLFNGELLLRFISPSQAVQTQTTSRTLGQYLFQMLKENCSLVFCLNDLKSIFIVTS